MSIVIFRGDDEIIVEGVKYLIKGDIHTVIEGGKRMKRKMIALEDPVYDASKNIWRIKTEFIK